MPRACLKIHSRNLHAPLRGIFGQNSLNRAHYAAFIFYSLPLENSDIVVQNSDIFVHRQHGFSTVKRAVLSPAFEPVQLGKRMGKIYRNGIRSGEN